MILLYSFEGTTFRYGGNSCEDTPVPMPNTEVKLTNAESTWLEAAWEDRKLPNKKRHLKRCLFYLAILVTPRPDDYAGKIVKGYRRKMRRPGEARRQSIVFASRNPQRNGIRRIPILKLRLAVELLNKETHHRDVMGFFSVLSYQAAKRFIVLNWLRRHMHLPSTFYMCQ